MVAPYALTKTADALREPEEGWLRSFLAAANASFLASSVNTWCRESGIKSLPAMLEHEHEFRQQNFYTFLLCATKARLDSTFQSEGRRVHRRSPLPNPWSSANPSRCSDGDDNDVHLPTVSQVPSSSATSVNADSRGHPPDLQDRCLSLEDITSLNDVLLVCGAKRDEREAQSSHETVGSSSMRTLSELDSRAIRSGPAPSPPSTIVSMGVRSRVSMTSEIGATIQPSGDSKALAWSVKVVDTLDTTGDGLVDSVGLDITGDGIVDQVKQLHFRTGGPHQQIKARRLSREEKQQFIRDALANGDAGLDISGDGLVDTVALDTSGDGHIDTLRALDFSPNMRRSIVQAQI